MNTIQCPSKNQLSEYALGRLKLDDSQDIEAHLETCEECRTTLQSAWKAEDAFLQSLRKKKDLKGNEPKDPIAHRDTGVQADAATRSEHPDFVRDYRILKVLGRGGMGAVYLAQNERFAGGKKVAIKLIKPDRMNDEKLMARFHRETAAMGAFEHPNLVSAIDAGEHNGRLYLVMEYVDGCNLADMVHRHGSLSTADACEAIRQAALGLQHACEQLDDFVHRDIKPSNLLVNRNGVVKIADLGLVRAGGLFEEDAALTASSSFLGTLDYMAPEQIDRGQDVDIRADIYSLGATLYKLLAGDAPFSDSQYGQFSKRIYAISHLPHQPLGELRPDLPQELLTVSEQLLAKSPTDRPTPPAEVANALEPFCGGSDLSTLVAMTVEQPDGVPKEVEKTSTFESARSAVVDTSRIERVPDSQSAPSDLTPPTTERSIIGEPAAKAEADSTGFFTRRRIGIGAAFLAPLLLLAGVLITINTGKGKLEVYVADGIDVDDVEVEIIRVDDGKTIEDGYELESGVNSWKLKAGEYLVTIAGPSGSKLKLTKERVSIAKNEPGRTELRYSPMVVAQTPEQQRETAKWLLNRFDNGWITVRIVGGNEVQVNVGESFPPEPFEITDVADWSFATPISKEDFLRLRGLSQLRSLRTRIAGDDCLMVFGKLPKLRSLFLVESNITGTGFQVPADWGQLSELHLDGNPISGSGLSCISKLPAIKWLNLYECNVNDKDLALVGQLENLEILECSNCQITSRGLKELEKMSRLNTLNLAGNVNVDDDAAPTLAKLPRLRALSLNGTLVTGDGLAKLPKYLKNLGVAGMELGDSDVATLAEFSKLQSLDLSSTLISDEALKSIASLTELQTLELNDTRISDDGIRQLSNLSKLSELSVKGTDVTNEGLEWIRRTLSVVTLTGPNGAETPIAEVNPEDELTKVTHSSIQPLSSPDLKPDLSLAPPQSLPNGDTYRMITRGHTGGVRDIAASDAAKLFVSGGEDGVIRIWKSATGELVRAIPMDEKIRALAWSPNGKEIAAAVGSTIHILNASTGKTAAKYSESLERVSDVTWPNADTIVACKDGRTITLWNRANGEFEHILLGGVSKLATLSSDSVLVHRRGSDFTVVDLTSRDSRKAIDLTDSNSWDGHETWSVSPDGTKVSVVQSPQHLVHVFEIKTGAKTSFPVGNSDPDSIHPDAALWYPNGSGLLIHVSDGGLQRWIQDWTLDPEPRFKRERRLPTAGDGGIADQSRSAMLFAHWDGAITRIAKGGSDPFIPSSHAASLYLTPLFWRMDDQHLCLPKVDKTINGNDGAAVMSFNARTGLGRTYPGLGDMFPAEQQTQAFGFRYHDGHQLIAIDLESGKEVDRLPRYPNDISSVAPNGRTCFCGGGESRQIVDLQTRVTVDSAPELLDDYNCIGWSPDSTRAVLSNNEGAVAIWKPNTSVHTIHSTNDRVVGFRFDDSKAEIHLIDVKGRILTCNLESDEVTDVISLNTPTDFAAFTADGSAVAILNQDLMRVRIVFLPHPYHAANIQLLRNHESLIVKQSGHYRLSEHATPHVMFVVESDSELKLYTERELQEQFDVSNAVSEIAFVEPAETSASVPDPATVAPTPEFSDKERFPSQMLTRPKALPGGEGQYAIITRGHAGRINDVAISPNESRFATGGVDRIARIWKRENGKVSLAQAIPMENSIEALAWSPDGKCLAISNGEDLQFIDPDSGRRFEKFQGYAREYHITDVEWSPDGKRLLVCDGSASLEILNWDTEDIQPPLPINACRLADWISKDSLLVYHADDSSSTFRIAVVDIESASTTKVLHVFAVADDHFRWSLSPDSTRVAMIPNGDDFEIIEIKTGDRRTVTSGDDIHGIGVSWVNENRLVGVVSQGSGETFLVTFSRDASEVDANRHRLVGRFGNGHKYRGNLAACTHPDGAITLAQPGSPPEFVPGTRAASGTLFWRNNGQLLCFSDVESSPNTTTRFLSLNCKSGELRYVNKPGMSFPATRQEDVLTLSANRLDTWSVLNRRITNFARPNISGQIQSISPEGSKLLAFDHDAQSLELFFSDRQQKTSVGNKTVWGAWNHPPMPTWTEDSSKLAYLDNGKPDNELNVIDEDEQNSYPLDTWAGALNWVGGNDNLIEVFDRGVLEIQTYSLSKKKIVKREPLDSDFTYAAATSDGTQVAFADEELGRFRIYDRRQRKTIGIVQLLPRYRAVAFDANGRYRGSSKVAENELAYLLRSDSGYRVLTPNEFDSKYESNAADSISLLDSLEPRPTDLNDRAARAQPIPNAKSAIITKGKPISPYSLVTNPAMIEGVDSWTLETPHHRGAVEWCCFSPDEKQFATSSSHDGTIRIYDADRLGLPLKILAPPDAGPIHWSPKTGNILVGGHFGKLREVNPKTGKIESEQTVADANSRVEELFVTEDGKRILLVREHAGSNQGHERSDRLEIWNKSERRVLLKKTFIHKIDVSRDGSQIVLLSGREEGQRRLIRINTEDGTKTQSPPKDFTAVGISPDGQHVAAAYSNGQVRIANLQSRKPHELRDPLPTSATTLRWSEDGKRIVVSMHAFGIRIINVGKGDTISIAPYQLPDINAFRMKWSKDGSQILAVDAGSVLMIDAKTLVVDPIRCSSTSYDQVRLSNDGLRPMANGETSYFHHLRSRWETWSANGQFHVMSHDSENFIRIRNTKSGTSTSFTCDSNVHVSAVALSPEGTVVGALEEHESGNRIKVWRTSDPSKPISVLVGKDAPFHFVFASETEVFVLSEDRVVKRQIPSGEKLWERDLEGLHRHDPSCINSSNLIAYKSDRLHVFDLENNKAIRTLNYRPQQLAWASGDQLVMSSGNGAVRVVDLQTESRRIVATDGVFNHNGPMECYFTHSGRFAVWPTVSEDVRCCDIKSGKLKTAIYLDNGWFEVSPGGHFRGSPNVDARLKIIATTSDGHQHNYTIGDFEDKFGWKNDPSQVWRVE